jgi:hypothetical protein
MSIRDEWRKLVREEEHLFMLDPYSGDPRARPVLMSAEIKKLTAGPWDDDLMGDRCARLTANLQDVVRGRRLVVCMEPFEARREAQIGRLDPPSDSVFDIRSVEKPGLRVFCRFAERNVLVAFTCAPRSVKVTWLDRLPLGDRYSKQWEHAVAECKREWIKLFPAHDAVSGDNLNDYLSNAFPE